MKTTRSNHTTVIHTCLRAVILFYCFLVAAGSDVTNFDQDDDVVTDDSVRTLIDLEDLFDEELSSPISPNSNDDKNKEHDSIGDFHEEESNTFSQSDNTLPREWDEKRTKSHSFGDFSSDFYSLPSSSYNSSSRRFASPSDVDRDFDAEELFIPMPYDGAVLSRSKRDLTAGSGEEVLKTQLIAQGTPTADELTDGSAANLQLRQEVVDAVILFLTSFYPGEVFRVEVTQVSAGSYIFSIDIAYETENLDINDLATAYDSLTVLRTVSDTFIILEQDLAPPGSGTDSLRPAICYICEAPQTCQDEPGIDGSTNWFCRTYSDFYYAFGTGQGDATLQKGNELATARITIQSRFPYYEELVTDVYISVNGIISFDEPYASFNVTTLPVDNRKLLAPYWADLDLMPSDSAANVFYQLYTKSPLNSPSQQAIFTKANSDVVNQMDVTVTSYDATSVIIVTWEAVPPWPGAINSVERVHFQAAIITDGSSTYVAYVYAQGGMNFNPVLNRRVAVGWDVYNFSPTPNPTYYVFDTVIGNTNLPGYWFFRIGQRPNYRAICLAWYSSLNTPQYRFIIQSLNRIVPSCPCNELAAIYDSFWLRSFEEANCYDMFPLLGRYGRRCCYRQDGSLGFENRIPLAGSLQLFTPYYPVPGNLRNHEIFDVLPKQWCCFESNLCPLYYQFRPSANCTGRRFRRCFMWGDPHIKTLDGKDYIFNGLGEYIIMKMEGQYTVESQVNGTTVNENRNILFELQGRTCQSKTSSGNLTTATQWCALAGKNTDNTTFRIGLSRTEPLYLEIYANGEDYSARFRDNPDFSVFAGNLALRKVNNSLSVFTTDNLGINVTLAGDVIEMSFQINEDLKGLCSGLFGNFNDDSTDDLRYRNDTVLPDSASEQDIFHMGQSWAITPEESLFVYDIGRNTSFYSDPNFQPLFLDEADIAVRTQAEAVCGQANIACVFDYIATQNQELALQSAIAIETFDEVEADISKIAPNITQVEIETTVNEPTNFTINAFDSDGGSIQLILLEQPGQGQLVYSNESGVFEASITPVSTDPITISVVAQDADGLQSEISQVTIRNCVGCGANGICDYNTTISEDGVYYSVSPCICSLPYSGDNCQDDKDGCAGDPCPSGTTCTDIPAEDELALGRPFNCSDCPAGYQLTNDSTKCIDIDECTTNTDNCDVNAECTNTVGSHFCTCNLGYRKSVDGSTCVDIDECTENSFKCAQICINTVGSYDCDCNEGFEKSGLLNRNCSRLDIDPCEAFQQNCSFGCRNNSGEAECFCEAGYRVAADGISCENIDECEDSLLCSQVCTDNIGSYVCSCYTGYTLNVDEHDCDACAEDRYGMNCEKVCECRGRATSCDPVQGCICTEQWTGENCLIDVNECLTENICPDDKSCTNTNGSYFCACPVGFEDANNDGNCTDVNECASISIHGCPQDCVNNPGSFHCECTSGYNYNSASNECDDIDECRIGTSGCIQRCENTVGSFNCFCEPGYVLADNRKDCIQEQELCTNKAEPCSQGCTVVNEQPTCICRLGFSLGSDSLTCFDINECDAGTHLCSDFCDNTNGSYSCTCPSGKELENDLRTCTDCDEYHWGDNCANECACNPIGAERCDPEAGCICNAGRSGDQCQDDIDECRVAVSPCPQNADCIDIVGSFICNCRTGYQLNTTSNECEDIDECEVNNPCDHECSNTVGSYICSCFAGFNPNGDRCIDINECDQPADVHACQQVCRNTQGSYACQCYEGYKLNTTNRRICIEEVSRTTCLENNTCDTNCRFENGEDICFCNPGFQLSSTNSSLCEDINECTTSQPCVSGSCDNNEGGFSCSCEVGFRLSEDQITCIACEEGRYGDGCLGICTCDTANTQECQSNDGTCVCINGYNGTNCENNINECENGEATCQDNAVCQDTPGSYRCVCAIGFATSGSACVSCSSTTYGTDCATQCSCVAANTVDCNDINGTCTCKPEWQGVNCSQDLNECNDTSVCNGENEHCENLPGSFVCVCDSGYTRISGVCFDIDECQQSTDDCETPQQMCVNTVGGFNCDCGRGYVENNAGVCEACSSTTYGTNCSSQCSCVETNTVDCNNVNGSCTCKPEWQGLNCDQDVNECNDPSVCNGENEDCQNSDGSYTCVCDTGYTNTSGVCTACSSTTYGTNCSSQCSCVETNTVDCNNVNGSCTCKPEWQGLNCDQDVNECNDPSVCNGENEDCQNSDGSYTCVCDTGYTNTSGVCTAPVTSFNLTITFDVDDTSLDANTFVSGTPEYQAMAANIEAALRALGIEAVGDALLSLVVRDIRSDGLVVDLGLEINQLETNNTEGSVALVIAAFYDAVTVNISNELQSAPLTSIEVNSNPVSADASVCSIFNTLTTCAAGFECRITNNVPSCQEKSDDDNFELIIGLGVGIPLFILLVIIIAVSVCLCLRKSRRSERESTPSADRDAPFRSVFAGQVATKSSLGSPHRFSMYSPDAYSEAGTSESSGDGQLLKSRQKVRSDFQDSPWYDNRGATPRDPTESQGAPTEAGAGPTSNFSWEYMFRLLEPHRGFEIQRPNLSPAPNPTYTPRGKQSESPA